ncbi:hypothetical protein ABT246_42520 [Streptomyces sp. NPDC001553]|uniref:hypothetical protein n=1 Tax=Streptomyces sp. NPDC001553 TaxID=3154385 RepID=UPI00332BF997
MGIDWKHIEQPRFDQIVEALVHRLYADRADVKVVNGRGGDGGIDIKVTLPDRVRILQLKCYNDGFQGSYKGRRPSIKKSFKDALVHDPDEWILVVPCTLSPSEDAFVMSLSKGAERPRVAVWNRAWLDDKLAAQADLRDNFLREDLREAAKDYGAELAFLAGGSDDVAHRMEALGQRIDRLDPHWSLDVAYRNGIVEQTLRPKHPRAQQVSPIAFRLQGSLKDADPGLAAVVMRVVGFGAAEELVLPPSSVLKLSVEGPDWLRINSENAEVRMTPLTPVPGQGATAELTFLDGAGGVQAVYEGTVHALGEGSAGQSMNLDFTGSRVAIYHPKQGDGTTAECGIDLAGLSCADALQALDFYERIMAGSAFRLRLGGLDVAAGTFPAAGFDAHDREAFQRLRMTVEDLDVVQKHCRFRFPVPADVQIAERAFLRIGRLLVDGLCVASPFVTTFSMELSGQDNPFLRDLVASDGVCHRATVDYVVQFAGRELPIGPVAIFHPRVHVEDPELLLQALEEGRAEGHRLTLRPADNEEYRLYFPKPDDTTDLNALIPTPLGIPGPRPSRHDSPDSTLAT